MAIEIVDSPIKNGDFPVRYVSLPEGINFHPFSSISSILFIQFPTEIHPQSQGSPFVADGCRPMGYVQVSSNMAGRCETYGWILKSIIGY